MSLCTRAGGRPSAAPGEQNLQRPPPRPCVGGGRGGDSSRRCLRRLRPSALPHPHLDIPARSQRCSVLDLPKTVPTWCHHCQRFYRTERGQGHIHCVTEIAQDTTQTRGQSTWEYHPGLPSQPPLPFCPPHPAHARPGTAMSGLLGAAPRNGFCPASSGAAQGWGRPCAWGQAGPPAPGSPRPRHR